MRPRPLALDEMRELLGVVERCLAHAVSAQQQAASRIAASHQRLAGSAVPVKVLLAGCSDAFKGARDGEASVRRPLHQDGIARARRHVAEGEGHIARQEQLVAKLSLGDRHTELAAEARVILATLKHSLRLAQEDLATELSK